MFDIYKKQFEFNGVTYELKPLSGKKLPKLYKVLKKLTPLSEASDETSTAEIFNALDEETVENLHEIVLETFKKSYPSQDADELDSFVSQNLLHLFGPVIEVNLGNQGKK